MRSVLVCAFWASVAWAAYAYAGYGLLLRLLALVRHRPVVRKDIYPKLSVIIAVHNGASEISAKLENALEQEYPPDRLEILVADDASTDGTDEVVSREFAGRGVRLVRLAERGGKERAQKEALTAARGEILVFTDVGTRLGPRGLATIVRSFADPTVGCVSSADRLLATEAGGGEGFYVGYETAVRRLEGEVGSLVGVSGSFFAARREICEGFSDRLASDFRTVLCCVRRGYRAVLDEEAVGYYRDVAKDSEFRRKVRTVVRGLNVLSVEKDLLNPFRHGLFAWQLFSHKLVKWTVPFAMVLALGACAALAPGSVAYGWLLALQVAAYLFALALILIPSASHRPIARASRYLLEANLAILVAWGRYVRGERIVAWNPSTR